MFHHDVDFVSLHCTVSLASSIGSISTAHSLCVTHEMGPIKIGTAMQGTFYLDLDEDVNPRKKVPRYPGTTQ